MKLILIPMISEMVAICLLCLLWKFRFKKRFWSRSPGGRGGSRSHPACTTATSSQIYKALRIWIAYTTGTIRGTIAPLFGIYVVVTICIAGLHYLVISVGSIASDYSLSDSLMEKAGARATSPAAKLTYMTGLIQSLEGRIDDLAQRDAVIAGSATLTFFLLLAAVKFWRRKFPMRICVVGLDSTFDARLRQWIFRDNKLGAIVCFSDGPWRGEDYRVEASHLRPFGPQYGFVIVESALRALRLIMVVLLSLYWVFKMFWIVFMFYIMSKAVYQVGTQQLHSAAQYVQSPQDRATLLIVQAQLQRVYQGLALNAMIPAFANTFLGLLPVAFLIWIRRRPWRQDVMYLDGEQQRAGNLLDLDYFEKEGWRCQVSIDKGTLFSSLLSRRRWIGLEWLFPPESAARVPLDVQVSSLPHIPGFGLVLPGLPIAADSGTAGRFCQESKIGGADAEGALDGFCPGRTIPRSGAHLLPTAAKSGLLVRELHTDNCRACQWWPGVLFIFAPADRRWRRRRGSASGSYGVRAVLAARAARRAALKPYRKFSQRGLVQPVLSRLMLDRSAPLDA